MRSKSFLVKGVLTAGIIVFILVLTGCALGTEFDGVWVYNPGPVTETISLSRSALYSEVTGMFTGSLSATIDLYAESSDHIRLTVTSANGLYALSAPPGTVFYGTYSISGNQMLWTVQTGSYPASAISGPYVKQ